MPWRAETVSEGELVWSSGPTRKGCGATVGLSPVSSGTAAFVQINSPLPECGFPPGNMTGKMEGSVPGVFIKAEIFSLESR